MDSKAAGFNGISIINNKKEKGKMVNKLKGLSIVLLVLFMVVLFALPVFAQEGDNPDPALVQLEPMQRPPSAQEFGLYDPSHTWIPAEAFNQRGTPNWTYHSNGYIYKNGGIRYFIAPVNLPTGVDIVRIKLYCYDNHAAADIVLWYLIYTTANNAGWSYQGAKTNGTPGFTTIQFDPFSSNPKTHIFNNHDMFVICVDMSAVNSPDLQFKGVRISYYRKISASPSTATFTDVPTNHPFFRQIEALAAAGISTGWADGTFRPNEPVTRQAMAAFLARALGLHHTDPY